MCITSWNRIFRPEREDRIIKQSKGAALMGIPREADCQLSALTHCTYTRRRVLSSSRRVSSNFVAVKSRRVEDVKCWAFSTLFGGGSPLDAEQAEESRRRRKGAIVGDTTLHTRITVCEIERLPSEKNQLLLASLHGSPSLPFADGGRCIHSRPNRLLDR